MVVLEPLESLYSAFLHDRTSGTAVNLNEDLALWFETQKHSFWGLKEEWDSKSGYFIMHLVWVLLVILAMLRTQVVKNRIFEAKV